METHNAEHASVFDDRLPGPKFVQLMGSVINALMQLGGSARPSEVYDLVASNLDVAASERDQLLKNGVSRFDNMVVWARFYLVRAGLIDSSQRGVWTLTDKGADSVNLRHHEAFALFEEIQARFKQNKNAHQTDDQSAEDAEPDCDPDDESLDSLVADHRQRVIELLRQLPPDGFERFSQRLLRESGFQQVEVTGRSGDGGIDGVGILEVSPLMSFRVLFQCKRYKGSVTPSEVRDFRGAMSGRADKGFIITTGSYTAEARKEAIRDGVSPIELLDGDRIVDMLEKLELGLTPVQAYVVDEAFFSSFW